MYHSNRNLGTFLLGALTAVAVGGYLLFGPRGAENRRKTERWLLRAKAEILERMGRAQDLTEEQYYRIVDEVVRNYAATKEATTEQAGRAAERFKARWEDMRRAAQEASRDARRELAEEDAGEQ